jgi:hypothetical protein
MVATIPALPHRDEPTGVGPLAFHLADERCSA